VPANTIPAEVVADLALLTEDQAAELLTVSQNTLKRLRRRGTGPRVTVLSDGRIAYRASHLRAWIDQQTEENTAVSSNRDEQTDAALHVLAGVKAKVIDNDPEAMLKPLRGSAREVSLRLAEATNLIAHLVKLSDRPEQMLAALVETVTAAAPGD
jgi:hypothetical protein